MKTLNKENANYKQVTLKLNKWYKITMNLSKSEYIFRPNEDAGLQLKGLFITNTGSIVTSGVIKDSFTIGEFSAEWLKKAYRIKTGYPNDRELNYFNDTLYNDQGDVVYKDGKFL